MTPEEKLAALLRDEASDVAPVGDGLTKIQKRLASRRRMRWTVLPGVALAATAAVAAVVVIAQRPGSSTLRQVPGGDGQVVLVGPTSTPDPLAGVDVYANATWPFTSEEQAKAWRADHGSMPWAADSQLVGQHFVTDFLHLTDVTLDSQCTKCFEKFLLGKGMVNGRGDIGEMAVAGDKDGPYSVYNVTGMGFSITSPQQFEKVASPLTVIGRINGVDESIRLSLVASDGTVLASTTTMAGHDTPWQATLTWSKDDWSNAMVVATTLSAKDGSTNRVLAQPVQRWDQSKPSPTPAQGPAFAGVIDGHVSLFDGESGHVLRQLTYPHGDDVDTEASYAAYSLLWVRAQPTGCHDGLYELTGKDPHTVVAPGKVHLASPTLSRDGKYGAWLETSCTGNDRTVVVAPADGTPRRIDVPGTDPVRVVDLTPDGGVLVRDGDHLVALDPGVTDFASGDTITAESGCTVTDAVELSPVLRSPLRNPSIFGLEHCADGLQPFNTSNGSPRSQGNAMAGVDAYSWRFGPGGVLVTYRKTEGGPLVLAEFFGNVQPNHFGPDLSDGRRISSASW